MNVSLPKDLEEFVAKKTASGEFPNPDAVVAAGLRELQSRAAAENEPESLRPLPDGTCPSELKSLLLEAINSPHHPMPANYFDQLRARLRSGAIK